MSNGRLPNIHKILIIRNDGIGDLLNSTPAIAMLRQNYVDAEITVLVQSLNAPILVGNPDIDQFLIFDRSNEHSQLRDRLRFYQNLRREKYDLAVVFYFVDYFFVPFGSEFKHFPALNICCFEQEVGGSEAAY